MRKIIQSLFGSNSTVVHFTIKKPENLSSKDIIGNGFASFDLTVNNKIVLDGLNAAEYTVNYFESEKEARLNIGSFENPERYYNMNPLTEEVFVRVSSKNSPSLYVIDSFTITVITVEKKIHEFLF